MSESPRPFTSSTLTTLRAEIDAALAGLAAARGITITAGRASYTRDGLSATFKLELAGTRADGTVASPDATAFTQYAASFGLQPSDLGRTFLSKGQRFRITGLKPGSPKFPVMAVSERDGRMFKFVAESVVALLAREPLGG